MSHRLCTGALLRRSPVMRVVAGCRRQMPTAASGHIWVCRKSRFAQQEAALKCPKQRGQWRGGAPKTWGFLNNFVGINVPKELDEARSEERRVGREWMW